MRPVLDNTFGSRHDLEAVIRALRFFALLSALFVVAVRCLGGFPLALVCVDAVVQGEGARACPAPDQPAEQDSLAPVALADDADDGAEPAVTPAPVEIRLLGYAGSAGIGCGTLVAQCALPSHAPNLERPPRA